MLTRINDPIEATVPCADGLTFSPDGTLYAVVSPVPTGFTNSQLVTIDLATGAQTLVGDLPPVILGNGGMTFDGAGNLWLYGLTPVGVDADCGQTGFESCLWQVNPADASTTPIANGAGSNTEVARVDTATAALDLVVEAGAVFGPEGLDFDFAGGLWTLARLPNVGFTPMEVASIDLTNGSSASTQLTLEGNPFIGFLNGLAISPLSCEEPPPPPIVIEPLFTG